jgi:hypothetical protein
VVGLRNLTARLTSHISLTNDGGGAPRIEAERIQIRIRTIGWRRKLDLLIDVRIKDLAKLIAYVDTGCAPVPRVDERTREGFNWDKVGIDISGDAARVGRSNRVRTSKRALPGCCDSLTTVKRLLEDPPSADGI